MISAFVQLTNTADAIQNTCLMSESRTEILANNDSAEIWKQANIGITIISITLQEVFNAYRSA